MTGHLHGVGLGPGDPELITLKAARLIEAADVVVFHAARHGRSIARSIAAAHLRDGQIEEPLIYPVTTEDTGDYRAVMEGFYDRCAERLAAHLDAGRDVVVLAEGDPFFYGSYMHLHKRLAARYPTEVVPGVTSVSGASAELGRPLVERDEVLTVLPGTLAPERLAERLTATDSAAVLKLGRTFGRVRDALEEAGRLDDAWYVERATTAGQRMLPLKDVDPGTVPYFSVAVLPSRVHEQTRRALPEKPREPKGEVVVVGLGPAGREWLTPQAQDALAAADDLIGYGPYLDRVPANARQTRYPSGNTVEADRAEHALALAEQGRRVAVVSSGDPGVFAMAAAVLEAAADERWRDVPVRVLPGLTAAQAVASRVGAPLGHDYCVVSLSDRLKPWKVIAGRLAAAATADLVVAIYNPASRTRTTQVAEARDILLKHRRPGTPVVIGRDVGGPAEDVKVVRLADLDPADVDMRTLLIVGSSQTKAVGGRVFTPRRYPG
ncbi:precorrin-2 C(20)-methyltransferase [Actinomadura parmotrematis]|uniref:Precorrin-2 C(20)-methyltransferase n=1 Tax=Actinomadura parmotrematis TaxID=2864039 RepID=A0ABS7FP55_9ACTN|nr:precorrin-2 C(20)-methyltransferase [Actinomadura parmotrematis]MBW8482146.1 precorrin-2 C(20)-methyltransferase [Actinomadura parmotrematis]